MTQSTDDLFKTLAEQQYYYHSEGGGGGVSQDQFAATSTPGMNLHFGDALASFTVGSNNINNNNTSIEEIVTSSGIVSANSNNDKSSAHNSTAFSSTPNSSNVSSIEYLLALQQQVAATNAVTNHHQQQPQGGTTCPSKTSTPLPWEVNASTSGGGSTFTDVLTQPQRRMSNSYAMMFGGEINDLTNTTNTNNSTMNYHPMLSTLLLNQQQQQQQNVSNLPNAIESMPAVVQSNSNNNVVANHSFVDIQHATTVAANTNVHDATFATNAQTRKPRQKTKQAGFPFCRLDSHNHNTKKKKSEMQSYRRLWSNMLRHKSQQEQDFVKQDFQNRLASGTVPILKDTSLCQFYDKDGTKVVVAAAAVPVIDDSATSRLKAALRLQHTKTEQQYLVTSSSSPRQTVTAKEDSSAPDKITFRKEPNLTTPLIFQRGQKRKVQNPPPDNNNHNKRSTTSSSSSSKFLKSRSVTTTTATKTTTTSTNDDSRKNEVKEPEDVSYTNHILNQARWMHAV